jgi:hypothetical protein
MGMFNTMGQHALKNVKNSLNTNIYSYLETSGGQSSNLYLNAVHFFNTVLIRHLWQLETVVFCIGVLAQASVLLKPVVVISSYFQSCSVLLIAQLLP